VFRDYNANGSRDNTTAFREPGLAGVIVTAYGVNNTVVGGPVTSSSTGGYSITPSGTGPYRLEFTLPADGSLDFLSAGAAGRTTVVFVADGGGTGIDVGFNNPTDYSQTNPPLITPRTAFGPRLPSGGMTGLPNTSWPAAGNDFANESVISIPYTANGDLSNTSQHSVFATLRQTGTLYGMMYQRRAKLILAGTYFKSYADTGPKITGQPVGSQWEWLNDVDPLGAIYAVQPTALAAIPADIPAATNARVYANLNKIINPATGQVISGNPAGVDPRRTGTINYDTTPYGDCNGPGTNGAPANAGTGKTCWHHDPVAFDQVGSIGLGDLEEDDNEQVVYVVNLADKRLYQLPIDTNPANWPIKTLAAPPVAIPTNGCANPADAVPGGLGFRDGKLYVGVTCTAESTTPPYDPAELAQLKAEVWQFNPATQTFGASPVFSVPLGYPRGCIFASNDSANGPKNQGFPLENCQPYKNWGAPSSNSFSPNTMDNANWNPWPQSWQQLYTNNKGINSPGKPGWVHGQMIQLEYPHPWLSDIAFDGNDLILGFRDIAGDRLGNVVRSPNINATLELDSTNAPLSYVWDRFASTSYSLNAGTVNWSTNWTETNETTDPAAGNIQVLVDSGVTGVNTSQLRVQGDAGSTVLRVQRSANFSASTGTLSFNYRRVSLEAGDQVTVEVSTDNGANWTTVATFSGPADDTQYSTGIYKISISSQTILRISANAAMDTSDRVWFDEVNIATANSDWMEDFTFNSTGAGLGDLLRACWNGSGWTLENNGTCGSVTTPGANNGQGPSTAGTYPPVPGAGFTGYGEYYWDDSGPGSRNPAQFTQGWSFPNYIGHEQTMKGGIFQQPGWPDIAVTIADQFTYGDGGIARFSNVVDHPDITLLANGNLQVNGTQVPTYPAVLADSNAATGNEAGLALRHTQLYGTELGPGFFGKSNGLGDLEALVNSAPLELGNRIWCDSGVSGGAYNGIQDPGEAGVNGVSVVLTCGLQSATVTTSGSALQAGSYLFTDAVWDAQITPGTPGDIIPRNANCTISVATTGANATALNNICGGGTLKVPTVSNAQGDASNNPLKDIRDSDAVQVLTGGAVTSAVISVLTGGPGGNNHGLDFGFAAERDYGDAPDPTYPTLASSNGANHVIVAGIRMGPAVDSEQDGQPNGSATGDDIVNVDDEDAVTFSARAAGQPAVASIDMTGLAGSPVCVLNAWIDFNGNGSWLDPGEQIASDLGLGGGGVVPIPFTVPSAVTTSPTYARFRCSTQPGLTPTGSAPDGEVEDYRVTIEQTASLDYGDAPDPTYPTLSGSGGASHVLGQAGPRLGACVDAEPDGQPSVGASGDDVAVGAPVFGACANNDDEDGVTFPPLLVEGVTANLTVNVSQAACLLNAWIDYNGDGDWNDAGEQVATNLPMGLGPNPVPVTPPVASTQATTYARFRCSVQPGLGPTGAAPDGEVEDYPVIIEAGAAPNDWGDAPDTGPGTGVGNYQTLGLDNGAHHVMNPNVYLGACVDNEIDGQPTVGAVGDDAGPALTTTYGACAIPNDDEDGVTIPTLLAGQVAQLQVSRTAPTLCYLNGWIDFNADGDWLDAGEQVATNLGLAPGVTNLPVSVPGGAASGQTYARFRCSTQQNLAPTGVASDGEVEDYVVDITGTAVDWGDLPAPYATLSANNGPSHVLSGVAFMGRCVDAESNGQPSGTATGDDANATTPRLGACATGANDDEDGVTFGALNAGANGTANVDMSAFNTGAQVCFLNAWIDFNGNGSFADAGDQIASNIQMIGGLTPNAVTFPIPSVVTSLPTGARFRCSTQSGLTPTGSAPNGEVEDYLVSITPQQRDFGDAPDAAPGTGVGNYNTTIADNGPSHLIVPNLRLGVVAPDADSGALQNPNADADDTTGTPDDEDGVTTLPAVSTASTSVPMSVSVFNNTGSPATVACWIDFNRDGVFSASERASAAVASSASQQTVNLTFSGFGAPVPGLSYLRCRVATAAGEVAAATGPAATGEVEDYPLNISGTDYGDAPDILPSTSTGDYNTRGADNGPYHVIVSGLHLGAVAPDNDPATLQDVLAQADNANNVNDEDGLSVIPSIFSNSTLIQMNVSATNTTANPAAMACWIDFNRDGDFLDNGERSADVVVPANSGTASYQVSLSGFDPPTLGVTYIRCRIAFSASNIANPTGAAASGEVEDYRTEQALAVLLASFAAAAQPDHILVSWETVSEASNSGFNLYRSLTADGEYTLLGYTPSAAPGSTQGAAYSYQDFDVAAGQTYWYKLEDIDLSGAATMHDPVSVVFQAPTAVELDTLAADVGQGSKALLWVLAALLVVGMALAAYRRRGAIA
jgi:hypothetical protein